MTMEVDDESKHDYMAALGNKDDDSVALGEDDPDRAEPRLMITKMVCF